MSEVRSAICLVIDRLNAAYLGALGNIWIRTPSFDRLAARSLAFDRAMIDSSDLTAGYDGLWTGRIPRRASSAGHATADRSLPAECRELGLPSVLVTDEPGIAAHSLSAAFDEVVQVAQPDLRQQTTDWQETQLAAFFAQAVEVLETHRPPALVWLHTGALGHVWDSPQTVRNQYGAEDDPPALSLFEPPSRVLRHDEDPDLLLGLRHAYAGEITVLDHCLGMLLDAIDGSDWKDALLAVTAMRGYPLGEHGIVGDAGTALFGELVRVPLLIRVPGDPRYGARFQTLAQPRDLYRTIGEWCRTGGHLVEPTATWANRGGSLLRARRMQEPFRLLAITHSPSGEIALATPAWFVRSPVLAAINNSVTDPPSGTGLTDLRPIELYVQPDDYFMVNEVSDRCQEAVEEFRNIVEAITAEETDELPPDFPLSPVLVHGLDPQSSD